MAFWKDRWNDIRGNLLWQIIVWICGGGILTAVTVVVRALQSHPFEWKFAAVVFVIAFLLCAVVVLLANRKGAALQPQPQSQAIATTVIQNAEVESINQIFASFDPRLTTDTTAAVSRIATAVPVLDREPFLVRYVVDCLLILMFEQTWNGIFKSQIDALYDLNVQPRSKEELFLHYIAAAAADPAFYDSYTFDQWLAWMRGETLLLLLQDERYAITVRGQAFLKYMVDYSKNARGKVL